MIYFLFGEFLIYPDNKYNNTFFDLYREYCPHSSHQPRKLGGYLELGQYFLKQNQKSYYCIIPYPFLSPFSSIVNGTILGTAAALTSKMKVKLEVETLDY